MGHAVHVRLYGKGHVGDAGSTVGANIYFVGVDAVGAQPDVGDVVGAQGMGDSGVRPSAQVGAHVENAVRFPGDDGPVIHDPGLEVDVGFQTGTVQREGLLPGVDQLNRPAGLHGQHGGKCLEGQAQFRSEAAAQLHGIYLDPGYWNIQHRGKLRPDLERPLG